MRPDDLPETGNVEDRRDEPGMLPVPWMNRFLRAVHNVSDELTWPWKEGPTQKGDLSNQLGYTQAGNEGQRSGPLRKPVNTEGEAAARYKFAPDDVVNSWTPQEQFLYQHHLNNLHGDGKVVRPDGQISTVSQMPAEVDGRFHNIPTIWDGKELPPEQAQDRAAEVGWDKWPSYDSEEEADRRYMEDMHPRMEQDTQDYQEAQQPDAPAQQDIQAAPPPEDIQPSVPPPDEPQDFARGGPVQRKPQSTLKRITQHPIFPRVKIVHAPVPYLAGSSADMKTVYIDPRVPTTINVNGKIIPTAAPLAVHELYERQAIQILLEAMHKHQYRPSGHTVDQIHGDVYTVAHEQAGNVAEMHFLHEHYGFNGADWERYQQIMHGIAQQTEKESLKGAPKDLYTFMYPHGAGIAHNHNHYGEGGSRPPLVRP